MAKRKEQAAATRARMISAAHELFSTAGFGATTMQAVADRAEVSVQLVYFVFRSKAELLSATAEDVAAGTPTPIPVIEREWFREALTTEDPHRALALMIDNGVDIYSRSAPLALAIREAARSEPAVGEMWERIQVNRKRAMGMVVAHLDQIGLLRDGLDAARATDVVHALVSHDTYLELVGRSGWTLEEYKEWLRDSVGRLLLREDAR